MPVESFKPSLEKSLENVGIRAGINTAEEGGKIPSVYLDGDLRVFAQDLGNHCAIQDLYLEGRELVYFNYEGEKVYMTADVFRTWINKFLVIFKKEREVERERGRKELVPVPLTVSKETAKAVLSCDSFLRAVRKLKAFNEVRLPIKREDGEIELLPIGYDEKSCIYTRKEAMSYSENKTLEEAHSWFNDTFGGFPFHDERSKAVLLAGLLALYGKHLLPEGGALRPGFLFHANKAGSGKSILAKACLYPVMGSAATAKFKQGSDLDKELEAFSIGGVPYIFLDNVYGSIQSASLDQLLTSKESMGRAMGGHGLFRAVNKAQIYVTGNNLELNEDAQRRFLFVDLFEKGDPEERKITKPLTDSVLISAQYRVEALASCWAFIRHWRDQGQPLGVNHLNTYEEFSGLMGGIVKGSGFSCPFLRASLLDETNPEKGEFKKLLHLVGKEMEEEKEKWTAQCLARVARKHGLLEGKVGTAGEGRELAIKKDKPPREYESNYEDQGYLSPSHGKRFGAFLSKHLKSEFTFKGEFVIEFGERSQKRKSEYTIKSTPHNEPF